VFTNVGGDTLYLNGVPYHPVRGPVNRWEQLSESEKRRLLAKGHHAFADSVWTIVRAMHDSGATYEECLDAYAEMYRASPRVLSVRKEKTWVTVTWADGTEEESIIDFEPGAPPRTMEEVHKDLMEEFWRDVRAGTMIAKGYVDDLTYTIFSPRPDIAKMKRLIERLAAGDTLSTEETMGTPLADKLFRADVARRVARSKQGEE
jgi:hypothetical protein